MNREDVLGQSPSGDPSPHHVPGANAAFSAAPGTETQRWDTWRERGAAHDRAVRRKMTIMAPLAVAAAALAYWVLV